MTSDPMYPDAGQGEVESDLLRRTLQGGISLGLRQGASLAVSLVGGIALARLLRPDEFGYYAIALISLAAVSVVGDGGIGASLIRQPEAPTDAELAGAFTFQLIGTSLLALLGIAVALLVHATTRVPAQGVAVVCLALIAPLIGTFKTIPTVSLERMVSFGSIGVAGLAEVTTFNTVSVAGAAAGFGPVSLGVGLVVAPVVGSTILAVARPWRPRLGLRDGHVAEHLRFGLPYQGVTFVSLAKDSVSPLLVGLLIGATQVGYVEWAQRLAAYAVLALFIVQRLLLTSFARLQSRPESLARGVEVALRTANAVVAPLALAVLVMARPITDVVFGHQWRPALDVFWWLWAANILVPTSIVAMAAINALGHSHLALRWSLVWMVATWAGCLPLVPLLGFVGYGVANALVQLTNLVFFRQVARLVPLPWLRCATPAWATAAVATGAAYGVAHLVGSRGLTQLLVFGAVLTVAYTGALIRWPQQLTGISPAGGRLRWLG